MTNKKMMDYMKDKKVEVKYLEQFINFEDFDNSENHDPKLYNINNASDYISKYSTKQVTLKFAPVKFDVEENKII